MMSGTYTLQLSAILTGLIKLRLHSFKFLIEANVTEVKKKLCRLSYLVQVNIKNKLAVLNPAFRGTKSWQTINSGVSLSRTDGYIYFFPMLLNFFTNGRLNVSVLKSG